MQESNLLEIKHRINIVDLISNYVSLKKRGSRFVGLCPFHPEKTPSFYVDPDKNFYKCFGCGESGDIFNFIQKHENLTFFEALTLLSEKAGMPIEIPQNNSEKKSEKDLILTANSYAEVYFKKCLELSQENIRSYLYKRGLDDQLVKHFNLGYSPLEWDGLLKYLRGQNISDNISMKAGLITKSEKGHIFDRFRNRIIFPIKNVMNKTIGFGGRIIEGNEPKYLNSPETAVFFKSKEFYGLNLSTKSISSNNYALIVEGYMDVIACHTAGITNAIAVLGTALTNDHIKRLSRYTNNILLCFDSDSAGIKAALRSGEMFQEEEMSVKIVSLPKGEDPDSFIKTNGRDSFLKFTKDALDLLDFEIKESIKTFDLNTNEGKVNALSQAAKIIAKEHNFIKQDTLIKSVSSLHPNFGSLIDVETQIRNEVRRQSNLIKLPNKNVKKTPINTENITLNNKYLKAQQIILSGMLQGYYSLDSIYNFLDSTYFDDYYVGISHLLEEAYNSQKNITYEELLEKAIKNDLTNNFYTILAKCNDMDFESPVADLINILINEKNKRNTYRKEELLNKMKEGKLTSDSSEYEELLSLIKGKSFRAK